MIRDELKSRIVGLLDRGMVGEVELTRPIDPKFGDFSSSFPLKEAKKLGKKPMELASDLVKKFADLDIVEKVEVAGPGFVNIFLKKSYWQGQVKDVLTADKKYGSSDMGKGKKARVEFVSANPTGPLHFGNARGGPIGDTISHVLEASGYEVLREYIDNDRGNQVLELGKTLAAKAGLIGLKEEDLTYKGDYTKDLAARVREKVGDLANKSEDQVINIFGQEGVKLQFEEIIGDSKAMGIDFDLIVHESDLQQKAKAEIAKLEKKGLIKKKDGALWFSPRQGPASQAKRGERGSPEATKNEFLDDRDAVVVKSDGNYTYFTADVVYHTQKFESGYDLVVDVFGSNTFGHVPKLKALATVLGFDLGKFKVILYQFVRIKRGNDIVNMSKRAGNFVTAREVLDEVGKDAFRFFILMHDANTHMDFDLNLAREKSSKNPVYYVQYAHARISSILAKAKIESSRFTVHGSQTVNYQLLTDNHEIDLIKQITRLPELVEDVSKSFAVHSLTIYARELADSFHKFYENCRVISDDKELSAARLDLVKATKITLANTLGLLGVSTPEKM